MSYGPVPGYNGYNNDGQNNDPGLYSSNRQAQQNQYMPVSVGSTQQSQQATAGYEWPNQPQSAYGSSNRNMSGVDMRGYGSNSSNIAQGQYDYARDPQSCVTQPAASASAYATSGSASRNSGLQGLNKLAYASGLDMQPPNRTQQDGSAYGRGASSTINRVQSPMQQEPQGCSWQYNTAPPRQYSTSPTMSALQISAAQALAGAVGRSNLSNVSNSQQQHQQTQQEMPRRTASPYTAPQGHARAPSAQSQRPVQSIAARMESSNPKSSASAQRSKKKNQQQVAPTSTASQRNSISNLMSSEADAPPASAATAQDSMPAYIDPSQVFNPYRKEHERRRQEAIEAEARRKREVAEAEKRRKQEALKAEETRRQKEVEAESKRLEEEAQREQAEERGELSFEAAAEAAASAAAAAAAALQRKQTGKKRKSTPAKKKTAEPPTAAKSAAPVPSPAQMPSASPPADGDMAAQMKFMMDKMKEFKQQDPATFQKLWDDMRKGGKNTVNGPPPPADVTASPQLTQRAPPTQNPKTQSAKQPPPATQPPTSFAMPPATPVLPDASAKAPSTSKVSRRGPGERPPGVHPHIPLNGYSVVVENKPEGLTDLGRFPAERRIRQAYQKSDKDHRAQAVNPGSLLPPVTPETAAAPPQTASVANGSSPTATSVEWPKDKREALAKAAIEALKSHSENASITISAEDIIAMLDTNPNYIKLCDLLEEKGLKFHRGQFARQLLASVPDLTKAQRQAPNAMAQAAATTQPTVSGLPPPGPIATAPVGPSPQHGPAGQYLGPPGPQYPNPPAMFPTNTAPPYQNGQTLYSAAHAVPMPGPPQPAYPSMWQQAQTSKQHRKVVPPPRPEPPPGSKEAMARKRDFSELVDLTQLSDNEDYVLSTRDDDRQSSSPEPENLLQKSTMTPGTGTPNNGHMVGAGPGPGPGPGPHHSGTPWREPARPGPPAKRKTILAKPINFGEALQKEYYDPKTVARDIMIAAGRHPLERPLNAHLAGMLETHIDINSDLNTFDWDAVDPGGPPAPKVEYTDIPAGPPRYQLGVRVQKQRKRKRVESDGDVIHVDSGVKEPPTKSVRLLDSDTLGDHPTSPALFARLEHRDAPRPMVKRKRGRPARVSLVAEATPEGSVISVSAKESIEPANAAAAGASTQTSPTRSRDPATPSMDGNSPASGHFFPSGKRRGRPPGAKNKALALSAMRNTASRGPGLAIEVEVPSKSTSPQVHPTFKCKWAACHDQLHNLATLRKHVATKHKPANKPYECWWKKCPQKDSSGTYRAEQVFDTEAEWMDHIKIVHLHQQALLYGDGPVSSPLSKQTQGIRSLLPAAASSQPRMSHSFPTPQNLHREPARTFSNLGAQTMAAAKTRYLSDAHGHATTPSLSPEANATLPHDRWVLTSLAPRKSSNGPSDVERVNGAEADANAIAHKAFLKTHRQEGQRGAVSAMAQAEQLVLSMEQRKKLTGVGLDRGGCTLVNEERRKTFVMNPKIRRVVDDEY
jgi:hypothetical protein